MASPSEIPRLVRTPAVRPWSRDCLVTSAKSGPGDAAAKRWTNVTMVKPCQKFICFRLKNVLDDFFALRKYLSGCHHILAVDWVQVGIIVEPRLLVKDLRATY